MFMKDINFYKNVLNKISNFDLNKLTTDDVIKIICEFGLVRDSKPLYREYTCYMNTADELGLWQRPNQLAITIEHLLKLNIESFLEVGTYKAATFLILKEFLKLKNKNLRCLTIDIYNRFTEEYLKELNIEFKQCEIKDVDLNFDLIFIDGNHSYEFVKRDFEYSLKLNPKYVLFHDINDQWCEGVIKFWNEIKNNYKHIEIVDDDKVMGLGLLFLEK